MGDHGGSESIVDIDYRYPGGAGGQHGVQGGFPSPRNAVTYIRGNPNDGSRDQASDYAGKSTFHSGDAENYLRATQFIKFTEETMNARDTHVGDTLDPVSQKLKGLRGLLGDGQIRGPGTGHHGVGLSRWYWPLPHGKEPGEAVVAGLGKGLEDMPGLPAIDPGGEGPLVGLDEHTEDFNQLLGTLARPIHGFGSTLPQFTMGI